MILVAFYRERTHLRDGFNNFVITVFVTGREFVEEIWSVCVDSICIKKIKDLDKLDLVVWFNTIIAIQKCELILKIIEKIFKINHLDTFFELKFKPLMQSKL